MRIKCFIFVCLWALGSAGVQGQGTIAFGNRVTGVIDAPVFDVTGARMSGPNAFVQLYAAPVGTFPLLPAGSPVAFRTGAGAGYWPTTSVTLPNVAPGAVASVQVKFWRDAASFEQATIKGEFPLLAITTGGVGSPPTLPANLIGLTSVMIIPEPGMLALSLITAFALVLRRKA